VKRVAVSLAVFAAAMLTVEGVGRVAKVDFRGTRRAFAAHPIYYRQPTVPVGEIFFRRPGPVDYRGRPIHDELAALGALGKEVYDGEAIVSAHYDRLGFRNRDELADWEIVMVGDSFTELGYLADEELFSSRVATQLGVRVKNLGVSFSGPYSYDYFLREHGKAPATTDALMMFFEGNDVSDGERELDELERVRAGGKRELRELDAQLQSSFVTAIVELFTPRKPPMGPFVNARFGDVPVWTVYAPPSSAQLSEKAQRALSGSLAEWAKISAALGVRPWLVYLPAKERVLHGHLQFLPNAQPKVAAWTPTDLPQHIQHLCQQNGIRFLDTTPALADETRRGTLTYNHVFDTHVNQRGSAVIADVIAAALGQRAK
jgi:hypothetical protein